MSEDYVRVTDPHVLRVMKQANELIDKGATIIYKITCNGCGVRYACEQLNQLHISYIHEDCGYTTQITDADLGFAVMFDLRKEENNGS